MSFGFVPYSFCVEVIVVELWLGAYPSSVEVIVIIFWLCAYPSCVEVIVVKFWLCVLFLLCRDDCD